MPSVGVLTCEHMNSLQVPDPQAMNINTVVSLLLATKENSQPCGRVHLFAMGVLYTTAQTMNESAITEVMGTQDPTVIAVARGKKRARNLDPALRTWLRDEVMCERFRNTKWASRGLAVHLARTTVHDIDEEGMSFYFWTIHSMDRLLCTGTSHLTRLVLAVRIRRSLVAGGGNMDEQPG